jgi:hypothetical protein
MHALRTVLSAVIESMTPGGPVTRMRWRTTLDMLVTLVVTVLAVVLTIGYQVVGRWARRTDPVD